MLSESLIFTLCALSAVGGFLILAGGVWLLSKRTIYLDAKGTEIASIDLAGKLKLQTHSPAIALFLIGLALMMYPIRVYERFVESAEIELAGKVEGHPDAFPVDIEAVVAAHKLNQPGPFTLEVPRLSGAHKVYRVLYIMTGALGDQAANLQNSKDGRRIELPAVVLPGGSSRLVETQAPVPAEFVGQPTVR